MNAEKYQREHQVRKEKTTESQEKRILDYLQSGRTLTSLQALVKFDCLALSQRITRLKSWGHNIETEMITTTSGKRIAKYKLIQ